MGAKDYYISTLSDHSYQILWTGTNPFEAIQKLKEANSPHRLELWTRAHAESPKGFSALAYREGGKTFVSQTFTFIHCDMVSRSN